MPCKYSKTCSHYRDNSYTCKRNWLALFYCGTSRERKNPSKVEQDKPIPFDASWLLTTMARMIKDGTWKWTSEPRKESWLNKHFKGLKKLNCLLP